MSVVIETKKPRGALNPGSTATRDRWQWSDFSEAIVRTAREIAMDDPMLWGVESCMWYHDQADIRESIARLSKEVGRGYLTRGSGDDNRDLFDRLTSPKGENLLYSIAEILCTCAVTEMKTGVPCKPTLPYGLENIGYPVVLGVIQERWDRKHESFGKRILRKLALNHSSHG